MIEWGNKVLLLLIPVVTVLFFIKSRRAAIHFPSIALLKQKGLKKRIRYYIGRYLILLGILGLMVALARPRNVNEHESIYGEGIDIAIVFDVSNSMESIDFDPNRIEVAKDTIAEFVEGRREDRIALIVFSGEAFTRIPLTMDHELLAESIEDLTVDSVTEEGTAIGMGISVGLNRLKKSEASSKIMILITDGDNNGGSIDPLTAGELAAKLGIKIYAIGIGSDETLLPDGFGGYQLLEGGFNEDLPKELAKMTGGKYYRAEDEQSLNDIFSKIDKLEKTDFETINYLEYNEYAFLIMKISLGLLAIGLLLDRYFYIKIP